ncbi:glycosyl hydrolase family 95 catalytic domain-containing protein [Jiangella alba]|uniref:Glycosyl hydrolase family 65, N-terminal domain n=1 Tax=Jiangella alba TaxID=561176 RepID=A0A1H5JH35_9ACTN|nr:NPCBM/NEW2 domain-containing protein [Jiangella alba]SEE51779.1 Glycosyl hydrolase family 65, N-terminal domain [Jiangella alba]
MPADVSRRRFLMTSAAAGLGAAGGLMTTASPALGRTPPENEDDDVLTRGIFDSAPATSWEHAFVSGNGDQGVMVFGEPRAETIIYNNHRYVLPNGSAGVEPPKIAGRLEEMRDLCLAGDFAGAENLFNGDWRLLHTQTYHPGHRMRLSMPGQGTVSGYGRVTDFRTGEVRVHWSDETGQWVRRSFVSRADNVVAHHIVAPAGNTMTLTITCDGNLSGRPGNVAYATIATAGDAPNEGYVDVRATYPEHPNSARAFQAVTRVVSDGGTVTVDGTTLRVSDASSVLLLTASDRYFDLAALDGGGLRTRLSGMDETYSQLRDRHVSIHQRIYDRLILDLGGDPADHALPTTELIARQRADPGTLNLALLEQIFDSGRYFLLSSSGYLPPRLTGLWTGGWGAAWSGDFTTDANVNLQVAGMNIGAMPEAAEAYANLVLNQVDDWKVNARNIYGADGLMAPTRTDGENGFMFHFSPWAGQMWTAGANWLLYPLYEHYLVTGDEDFLRRRLLPALIQTATFYEGFLTRTDDDGNVIFVPSMSPENHPANTNRLTTINATMDVAAGKNALQTAIEVCQRLGVQTGPGQGVERWTALLAKIPPYRINDEGALAEWGWPTLQDAYDHRHSSHVYPAWPLHEISPEETPELHAAVQRALDLRGDSNRSAHGFLQRGLGAVRVKDGQYGYEMLKKILTQDFLHRSLMTSHNPGLHIYNADAANAMPAILMEMLVYSKPGVVELLPALPNQLARGSVAGIRCLGRVAVEQLTWDLDRRHVQAKLRSDVTQDITLISRRGIKRVTGRPSTAPSELGDFARVVTLPAGVPVNLRIELPTPGHLLESIATDGKQLPDFDGYVTEYTVQVPVGSPVPDVTAVPVSARVNVSIEPATALPGTTLVHAMVRHEDLERTYAIHFEPVNFTYLSDRAWVSATTGWANVQRDRSIDGNPITLRGPDGPVTYKKGIGTHAVSEIVYDLEGLENGRFQCFVGIDQEQSGTGGSVTFDVYLDNDRVFSSGSMAYASAQKFVDAPIEGRHTLRLVVGDDGNGIGNDHADWADAKITLS